MFITVTCQVCISRHCLNIHECLSVSPSSILHSPDLMVTHLSIPPHYGLGFILMMWCSVIGCLADLRTTAGP